MVKATDAMESGMPTSSAATKLSSKSSRAFEVSIKDAEALLAHCEALGDPLPQSAEVFKRAGLVMAMTAWETYVEDRVLEALQSRLNGDGGAAAKFMLMKLEEELKRFNNPTSAKTKKIFTDYLDIDIATGWKWNHFDPPRVTERLDELLRIRGDAVHRSKQMHPGMPAPHLVTKLQLEKAIRFLKELVNATERVLSTAACG